MTAEAVGDAFKDKRDSIVVLDIAAGTGFVAEEVYEHNIKIRCTIIMVPD